MYNARIVPISYHSRRYSAQQMYHLTKSVLVLLALLSARSRAEQSCKPPDTLLRNDSTVITHYECYPNGRLRVADQLVNGQLHGVSKSWHENGQLAREERFVQGKTHGPRQGWHPDGELAVRKPFAHGTPVDTHKVWWDNGNLKKLTVFDSSGRNDGPKVTWQEDGTTIDSTFYVDGKYVSEHLYWPNGKLKSYTLRGEPGKIKEATFHNPKGKLVAEIKDGEGEAVDFRDDGKIVGWYDVRGGKLIRRR